MSKVALSGDILGTGTFTIASPNSNTNRTLTLPDATGTVQVSGNPISGTTGTFSGAVSGTTGAFPSGVSVGPSVTFGDATVQTTAANVTTLDAIGSVAMFWSSRSIVTAAGSNISGSYLFRCTAAGSGNTLSAIRSIGAEIPAGQWSAALDRTTAVTANGTTLTPNSGTWKCLTFLPAAYLLSCVGNYYVPVLAVRVA